MKRIVFTNQKGGVGKTTLTRELGFYIASLGYSVLLVDADPQGNLTKSLADEGPGLYEAVSGDGLSIEAINDHLSILKGGVKLALLEKQLLGELDAYTRFVELFSVQEVQKFDFIFLDTPPSLGIITVNALTCADALIVPASCGLYTLQGTNDLLSTIAKVKKSLNREIFILGVIVNAFDSVPVITRQIRDEIADSFGEKVFRTALSKSIKLEEAIAMKDGVINHPKMDSSRAAVEIASIGDELILRMSRSKPISVSLS